MSNKADTKPKKRLTLKDIEKHLQRQDLTTANAVFFGALLWSLGMILMALTLWYGREGAGIKGLFNTFLAMHTFGWLITAYIMFRWSSIRRHLKKRIEEE